MSKKIETLKNGMKIISHKLSGLHSVAISLNFKVGSLNENKNNSGITHLCEHLFFRQLNDLSQKKLYQKMYMMGCEMGGNTSTDYVSFKMKVAPEFFKEAINILTKILDSFQWSDESIEAEKRVVIKQIENKSYSFENWVDSYYFENTQYTEPIMGDVETVERLTPDEINAWKEKYFNCSNSCLIVTGNYDEDYLDTVKELLNSLPNSKVIKENVNVIPENFCNRNKSNRYSFAECSEDYSEVVVFFDIDSTVNYETMRLLASILCDGCGSKLGIAMREESSVTDEIYSRLISYGEFSRLYISYVVHMKLLYKSLKLLFDTIGDLKKKITQDEYLSSICFFTKNHLFDLDDSERLNYIYCISDFVFNSPISEPNALKQAYENISICDLLNCADRVLCKNNLSFLIETSKDFSKVEKKINDILKEFD